MSKLQNRKLMHVTGAAVIGALLSGCASKDTFATFRGAQNDGAQGACAGFDAPQYEVKGATPYDQQWADKQVEAGVAGCDWQRPLPRPLEFDAPPVKPVVAAPSPPKKKSGLWNRVKSKFKPKPALPTS